MYQRFSLAVAIAAVLCPSLAVGADESELDPVVVTANRAPVARSQTLAAVTVLTREDIERSQAPDLLSLLARQPGISIARTGGPGQASTVFLRGGNSQHTLVLIDGVRINPVTQGAVDFAHIPLLQVERIEIVRGPRAALWGSDAIGGVIQIFTRDPSQAFFEAHAGSDSRVGAGAGGGWSGERGEIGLALGSDRTRGFSATTPDYPYCFPACPDDDGYRNRSAVLRGATTLGSQRLSANLFATNAFVEFDEGETDARNRVYALQLQGPLAAGWTHALVIGRSSEDLDTPAYLSKFGSARTTLDWTVSHAFAGESSLDLGLNLSREYGYSYEFYSGGFDEDRHNTGVFAAWRGRVGRHAWEASLRHDQNSQFDGATTGSLAWGYQASEAWRLRASVGQGFRAPSFNELYYPGFFGFFAGYDGLEPERSQTAEAGVDWRASAHARLGLSVYHTRVRDLIAFSRPPLYRAENIDRARIEGAELEFEASFGRLELRGNANWLDARNDDTDEALARRAPRNGALSADWRFGNGAGVGLDLTAVSERPDAGGARLAGYSRIDLRASAPLAGGWTAEARVENLGDRDYRLVDFYNTPGRSVLFSLRWDRR